MTRVRAHLSLAVALLAAALAGAGARAQEGFISLEATTGLATDRFDFVFDTQEPAVAITSPASGATIPGRTVTVQGTVTDLASSTGPLSSPLRSEIYYLVTDPATGEVIVSGSAPLTGGAFTLSSLNVGIGRRFIEVVAGDSAGQLGRNLLDIETTPVDVVVTITSPADGSVQLGSQVAISGSVSVAPDGVTVNGIPATVTGTSFTVTGIPLANGTNTLVAVATVGPDTGSASTTVYRDPGTPLVIPPDPSVLAPPLDMGVATTTFAATEFLYTGPDAIQTGVAPGTIDRLRAAVLRGLVIGRDGVPLPGVRVSALDHPEYGETHTRSDGMFDLVVNGGGLLTVVYERPGFIPAQRTREVPWQDFAWLDDVALVPYDGQVTPIALGSGAIQVARGSPVRDADGFRQATLLFPPALSGTLRLPDGSSVPLPSLNVRATEYTVGPNGEKAMPAPLPPSSAYTYAVELSADEAIMAGAREVRFNAPVAVYVENFLDFPVGTAAPVGYYDRALGQWRVEEDGIVLEIVGETAGAADLDVDGDGSPDGSPALAALGITTEEREQLAGLYDPGTGLWRVRIDHFSPVDINWPFRTPADATAHAGEVGPPPPAQQPVPCETGHSTIETCTQTLREQISLVGVGQSLHYLGDRVPGRVENRTLQTLTDPTLPASLERIEAVAFVAGQRIEIPPTARADELIQTQWDGKDAYGRTLQGKQPATLAVGHVYRPDFAAPLDRGRSFASFGESVLVNNPARQEITVWKNERTALGGWDARGQGLGGFTLSTQHVYDPIGRTLLEGNGRRTTNFAPVISAVAGTGAPGGGGNGGPALSAGFESPRDIAVAPDGNIYVSEGSFTSGRIRRIAPNGVVTTIAGGGSSFCDNCPATDTDLIGNSGIAVGPDGAVYIAETGRNRVRKVLFGEINTVAGTGTAGLLGDGGHPLSAELFLPGDVAFGPDRAMYIAHRFNDRIRRVRGDYIDTVFAEAAPCRAFGAPTQRNIAVDLDGSLYIPQGCRVVRVAPDGRATVVAGRSPEPGVPFGGSLALGAWGNTGDGGSARAAKIDAEWVAVDRAGSLYLAGATFCHCVRKIDRDGVITRLAGTAEGGGDSGDGGPAQLAVFRDGVVPVTDPLGEIYLADAGNHRVRRIGTPLRGLAADPEIRVPARDGSEVHVFSRDGRHLTTEDALTGAVTRTFNYGANGLLASMEDRVGNETTIERDSGGRPISITSPYGQQTQLATDTNGFLRTIRNPASNAHTLQYTPEGLLTHYTEPNGGLAKQFGYDALGRLASAQAPDGKSLFFSRTDARGEYAVDQRSGGGVQKSYQVAKTPTDAEARVDVDPAGLAQDSTRTQDGTRTVAQPDGTQIARRDTADPRFGMLAPLAGSIAVSTPGGLSLLHTRTRETTTDPTTGLLLTQTDTLTLNGRTSAVAYAAATAIATTTTAAGREVYEQIDPLGRLVATQVAGLEAVGLGYDARGRLASVVQGTGAAQRTTIYGYDAAGNLASVIDPLLRTVNFTYDGAGRVVRQTLPDSRFIDFTYDANGNLTSLAPPGRPPHVFRYTAGNVEAEYEPPSVGAGDPRTFYTYDVDRRLARVDRPDGASIALDYDGAGRLSTLTTPRGVATQTYSPTTGNVASIVAPGNEALSFSYDGSLVTATAWSGTVNGTVSQGYDDDFRVAAQFVNGGLAASFAYDLDGLLVQAGSETLTRDPANGLLTGTTLLSTATAQTYNAFGELASDSAAFGATSVYANAYTRDKLGRITRKVETIQGATTTLEYGYDLAGRLTQVDVNGVAARVYAYDANGNRTSVTSSSGVTSGTYDAQDRLLSYGGATYTHNAAGDLVSKTDAAGTTQYAYDALGNLTQVNLPDGRVIAYVIDGQNRRVGKKVNGVLVQGWLYQDQLEPVAELDGAGNVTARLVYGSRPNIPDYVVAASGTYRIFSDHLGSPRLVVNASTGAIAQRLDYDEFGRVTQDTAPGAQPFGFAGGVYDADTGLVRFGARDYDAQTGKWATKDRAGFAADSTSLFAYSASDPVNSLDPTGFVSATFKLFPKGYGFSFTYGIDANGQFASITIGAGLGVGLSVSPTGSFVASPDKFDQTPPPGTTTTFIGVTYGASAGIGPVSVGGNYTGGLGVADDPCEPGQIQTKFIESTGVKPSVSAKKDLALGGAIQVGITIGIGGF